MVYLKNNMLSKIEVSYKTIVFTVFFLISIWLLYQIKEIIFLVFVSFILMSALKPWVDYLSRYRIPKILSVLIVYLTFLSLLVFIGSAIIPPLITQSAHLGESLPSYLSLVSPFIKLDTDIILKQVAPLSQNLLKVTIGIFGDIVALFTIFVISFYLVIERRNLEVHLTSFMGEKGGGQLLTIMKKIEERLGAWVRGQVTLMFTIGLFTFVGLLLLGVQYVLPLAIIAGILEIVPTIGPIISSIPAILVALTVSPFLAGAVAVLFFVIQQIENQLVVPLVMKKAVGLPPLVTLLALMIGGKLAGIGGAILAIPMVVTIETVISEYFKLKEIH